jgi:hypothetical protein
MEFNKKVDPREVTNLEGGLGLKKLNQIAHQFGYKRQGYEDGAPIMNFLRDNPGACEAIVNWILEQPVYMQQIESEFGQEEDPYEHDSIHGKNANK